MSEATAYGSVGSIITIVEGIFQLEVSYTVALKVQPPQNANYTIEKETGSMDSFGRATYAPIKGETDLLEDSKEFRICISENVGDNGSYIDDKCKFYSTWNIMDKIDVYVPVKIEVSKLVADQPEDYVEGEVSAIVELLDPPENIHIIKGPKGKGRNGSNFIVKFIEKMAYYKESRVDERAGDNCPSNLAPIEFSDRCRRLKEDVDKAQKVILDEKKGQFQVLIGNPNAVIVPITSLEDKVDENTGKVRKIGYARILLHFPPIAGNNYRLKIGLVNREGKEISIRDKNKPGLHRLYAQTPTITLWKKVKMEMVALQDGINYNSVNWGVMKSTFKDAFIELEEPPSNKRYTIKREEWMEYLEDEVYNGWHYKEWQEYLKHTNEQEQDFKDYSFPQYHPNIPGSQKLTPPDNDPNNPNRDTWTFLKNIAKRIFKEKLGEQKYDRMMDPSKGYDMGFCALICKPPFKGSVVGGLCFYNKMFYIVLGRNMESTFAHEFGHALFLRHAPTYFVINSNIPYTTRCEESGSEGPYWDDHDSEDMMTCLMSYADTSEWHFCGLCLLKLRLYDIINKKDGTLKCILRRILYRKKLKIYWIKKGFKQGLPWITLNSPKKEQSVELKEGDKLELIVLYPREGVPVYFPNNVLGRQYIDFCKDLSKHPRGEWISTNKTVGEVNVESEGDLWRAKFIIKGEGSTEIRYRICIDKNKNKFNESDTLVLEVKKFEKVVKGVTETWYKISINPKQSTGSKQPVLGAS